MRNAIWFEFALAISLPRLLDRVWPSTIELTPSVRRLNRRLAVGMVAFAVTFAAIQMAALPARLTKAFQPAAAAAVARAAGPRGTVFADDKHSDWLLWEQPALVGRIAYDVRFELFDAQEMAQIPRLRRRCPLGLAALRSFGERRHVCIGRSSRPCSRGTGS